MSSPETELTFLRDASPAQLERAAALNHLELFNCNALAEGGEVRQRDGLTWTYSPWEKGGGVISFPELDDETAGERINEVIAYYLERGPKNLIGCWSLDPPRPRDLGVRLLARGFQPGWQPNWMSLDLEQIAADHSRPEGLEIKVDEDMSVRDVPDLPYSFRSDGEQMIDTEEFRGRSWHYVAYLNGKPIGHASIFLTFGPLGVGGIYNVGVIPELQNKGIGKAVTAAACLRAKEEGCRYVLLNGTGQRMYEQIGFRHIGWGQTWWLNVPRLAKSPPTALQIELAEAVGHGDPEALNGLKSRVGPEDLNVKLTNEMSLLDLAVDQKKPESAEWLLENGAEPDLLAFREFGWLGRAERLLTETPGIVNRRFGDWDVTPMHVAVENNDLGFAKLLLRYGPDLELKDKAFKSTPLGWAEHFQRTEMIELLKGSRRGSEG